MKKLFLLSVLLLFTVSVFSTQVFVVGEVFTQTWCGWCPSARSALRQIYENTEDFPYFIPIIWQGDGPHPSPNYSARASFYGVSGIPHAQFNGYLSQVGGGAGAYGAYVNRYNQIVNNPSPIIMDAELDVVGSNLVFTVDVELIDDITTTNNKIVFILTYNLDDEQPGDYFASVTSYTDQDFLLTSNGQTGEFTHNFPINPNFNLSNYRAIALIQTFSGNKIIHQAVKRSYLDDTAPVNLTAVAGDGVVDLEWEGPADFEPDGYNLYRNDTQLNTDLIEDTFYSDTDVENNNTYTYYVTAVYGDEESGPSNSVMATPLSAGIVQIGTGTAVNGTTNAAPINVYYRSLRGQMVYTTDEINNAGYSGAGTIEALAFYVESPPAHNLPNFIVRMKHTTANDASAHDNGPFDLVYSVASYAPTAGGWDILTLDTPFEWNGVDNILVDTAFSMVPSWNASGQQRVFTQNNGFRYTWSDTADQSNATTTTTANYKPQIRLYFGDYEPPEFPPPANLVAYAGDAMVELEWDAPQVRTLLGYNIYRDDVQINQEIIEETEYVDLDVENDVTYTYFVTAVYENGESDPSNSVEATPEEIIIDLIAPHDLVLTVMDVNNVLLEWDIEEYEEEEMYEFRYDDGVVDAQLGFQGTTNSVMGAAHRHNAEIHEITWITTAEGGPHNVVNVFLFGLDANGMPDRNDILYHAQNVPNTDNQWTTHELPEPVLAPNGFLVGLSYNGFLGLAVDDGIGAPWEFVPNTQFGIFDYTDTAYNWTDIDFWGFQVNYLLRAYGYDYGELRYADDIVINSNGNVVSDGLMSRFCNNNSNFNNNFVHVNTPQHPRNNRNPVLTGFNIYRNDEVIAVTDAETMTYFDEDLADGHYVYYVTALYGDLESEASNSEEVEFVNIGDAYEVATLTRLKGNYPNPFNPETSIEFSVKEAGFVLVEIYNVRGQKIRTLVNETKDAGYHSVVWNGKDDNSNSAGSGIFFYRMKAGNYNQVRKMILLK